MGGNPSKGPPIPVRVFLSRCNGGFNGTVVGRIDDSFAARLAEDSVISDVAPSDRIPESGGGGGDGLVLHDGDKLHGGETGVKTFLYFFLRAEQMPYFTGSKRGLTVRTGGGSGAEPTRGNSFVEGEG